MIYDLLEVFRKEYEVKGDKLILDNYILKDGLYIKVNDDESMEYFIFSNDKKQETKENCFKDLDGSIQKNAYAWFKERDYYSVYLNSNKSFYDKKIHNVNYLSFFVKVESFNEKSDKKLDINSIKGQYEALCNYKKFKKPKEKEILKEYQKDLCNRFRRKDVIKKYRFIEENIQKIALLATEKNVINYIKIFFEAPIDQYQKESEIYYAIKIFNNIDFSYKINESTYGLSDSNLGMGGGLNDSKKPFFQLKTRKLLLPFMLLKDDAILVKKFFDWLKFQDYQNKTPLGSQFFINRDFKEKDIVTDFDYLPIKIEKFENSIYLKNHLLITKNKILVDDDTIDKLSQLEAIVDDVLYNNQLIYNYYNDVYNKLDKSFANLIYITRNAMINYFKKYDEKEFYQVIKKYGTAFVIEHLRQKDEKKYFFSELKAKESLNLIQSLKQHKGEKVMDILSMEKKIVERLETSDYSDLNNEEFFYLCGQVASYLLSKKNQHEKMHDLVEPFLRANNAQKLKKEIEFAFFQYNHAIHFNAKKINNAITLIEAYKGEEKLSYFVDSFLIGYLSNTYIFKSKEEN